MHWHRSVWSVLFMVASMALWVKVDVTWVRGTDAQGVQGWVLLKAYPLYLFTNFWEKQVFNLVKFSRKWIICIKYVSLNSKPDLLKLLFKIICLVASTGCLSPSWRLMWWKRHAHVCWLRQRRLRGRWCHLLYRNVWW